MQGLGSLLRPGQQRQVVGQSPDPSQFPGRRPQDLLARDEHAIQHPLQIPLDGGQRGTQLMGNLGDEPDTPLFGGVQRLGQGIEILGEGGQLNLGRCLDPFPVRTLCHPP